MCIPGGVSCVAALIRALLKDFSRRLPVIPKIVMSLAMADSFLEDYNQGGGQAMTALPVSTGKRLRLRDRR